MTHNHLLYPGPIRENWPKRMRTRGSTLIPAVVPELLADPEALERLAGQAVSAPNQLGVTFYFYFYITLFYLELAAGDVDLTQRLELAVLKGVAFHSSTASCAADPIPAKLAAAAATANPTARRVQRCHHAGGPSRVGIVGAVSAAAASQSSSARSTASAMACCPP